VSDDLYDLKNLLDQSSALGPARMVVVNPVDSATLESVNQAARTGVVHPVLVGPAAQIRDSAARLGIESGEFDLVDADRDTVLERSARLLGEGAADFIMKGMVATGAFMHVLLDPKYGVRTESILSHVGLIEMPKTRRLYFMSDGALNIRPNFSRKIMILQNAVTAARAMGLDRPRVAMLAAVETVKLPAMPATLDAFLMSKYAQTGALGECDVEGPFAFDNAIDPQRADEKGIGGRVAGRANVLIVPNIETGNVIWKMVTCVEGGTPAGVVMGGSCPIVVPSRADDTATKLMSIQFARLLLEKSALFQA
jgi:phosphotransacetylase